jgi:hypothetical protein
MRADLVEADVGATKCAPPAARSLEPRRSASLISGMATGPPAGVGSGLGPFLAACTPRFSDFSRPVAAPAFQVLDTQLKALPALPVLARGVSGCVNSPFLGLFRTFSGPQPFRSWMNRPAPGSAGGPRRFTGERTVFVVDSLPLFSLPDVDPSHGAPPCVPGKEKSLKHSH